jgi:hypothetical protein
LLKTEIARLNALLLEPKPVVSGQEASQRKLVADILKGLNREGMKIVQQIATLGTVSLTKLELQFGFTSEMVHKTLGTVVPKGLVLNDTNRLSLSPEMKSAILFVLDLQED